MKVSESSQENSTITFTITVEENEWSGYQKSALQKIASQVKVDGFRKGHVPESVLKTHVGEEAIMAEALDIAISKSYMKALQEKDIKPIAQAEVSIEKTSPPEFTVSAQVYPEVSLQKMDFSKIQVKTPKVTKKEIAEQVEMFQKNAAENVVVERAVKKGDIAIISFDGKNKEGVSQEGMQSDNHPLEVGSNTFIPGFEDAVIGMKTGEEKTFPITFPKEYHATEYAGKEFDFTVKIIEVQEKKLPKVDDAFVVKITGGEQETVAAFEEEIKKHLQEKKKNEEYNKKQRELFDYIGKNTSAEIPPIFLQDELDGMVDNIKMQGLYAGLPWEKHLANMGKTEEELREEMKKEAKKSVLSRLGLQKMIEEDSDLEVAEEEILAEKEKELSRMKPEEQEKKKAEYAEGAQGWLKIENRLYIRKFFEKHLKAS